MPVFRCDACGAAVPADRLLETGFHCPGFGGGDDGDHVLQPEASAAATGTAGPLGHSGNPFLDYRQQLTAWQVARALGLDDAVFVEIVRGLDAAIAQVEGHGFRETPFARHGALENALGFTRAGSVWVKDETGNVSGSHKARHLMGVMLYLKVIARARVMNGGSEARLAIASCGNAALAAAVVARAAGRPLDVFVPPSATPAVVERLRRLGAHLVVCHRREGERGDPCYLRFHEAVATGSLAFCCQGPDNALTVEGGETIAWEMVDQRRGEAIDRVFVQVGGGAFASACVRGLRWAVAEGRLPRLPRIHAVQTAGGFPLARAWARVVLCALETLLAEGVDCNLLVPAGREGVGLEQAHVALRTLASARGDDRDAGARAAAVNPHALQACAEGLCGELGAAAATQAVRSAVTERSSAMWPWECEPHSLAHGILDDETYDWRCVVEGMLESGGWPVVVTEDQIDRANALARSTTGVSVDHTGSAGLAGLVALIDASRQHADLPRVVAPTERVAVILSGASR